MFGSDCVTLIILDVDEFLTPYKKVDPCCWLVLLLSSSLHPFYVNTKETKHSLHPRLSFISRSMSPGGQMCQM